MQVIKTMKGELMAHHNIKEVMETSFVGITGVSFSVAGVLGLIQLVLGIMVAALSVAILYYKFKRIRRAVLFNEEQDEKDKDKK